MRLPPTHPATETLELLSVLRALGDPVRMRIVRTLAESGERGWGDLHVPVAKSTLSQHLSVLRDAGIVRTRRDGQRCFVSLREHDLQTRFPGVLSHVLAAARADGSEDSARD